MSRALILTILLAALAPCLATVGGYVFGINALKVTLHGQVIDSATAMWLSLLTTVAFAPVTDWRFRPARLLSRVGAVAIALFGLLSVVQAISGATIIPIVSLRNPLVATESYLSFTSVPIDIAVSLLVSSSALLCLEFLGKSRPLVFQSIALVGALPAFFLTVAFIFGVADRIDVICAYENCVQLVYANYMSLLLLNTGILFARPKLGLTSFLSVDSAGSRQVRTSLAGLFLMLPILWVLFMAKHHGVINEPALIVLSLLAFFVMVIAIVAYNARKINQIDKEKQATEQSLSDAQARQSTSLNFKMLCLECFREFPQGITVCPDDNSELSKVLDRLAPGAVLSEKYEIIEVLGFGGMSTVYKARHLVFDSIVAVKLLNHQLASDTKAVQRFQVEAKAAHALNQSNILNVKDFGMSQEGQAYIVMDYLNGDSLADIITAYKYLPISRAIPIFLGICRGLEYAHNKGIIHRDIKPGNIMMVADEDGREMPKIVDFGLAKVYTETDLKLTTTGEVHGSPLYMSPEQCRGLPVDNRSDIYSLGVLMYEALSGSAPLIGNSAYETFRKKLTDLPAPFEASLAVPEPLAAVIMDCLKADASLRPPSAAVLARMLQQAVLPVGH